MSPVEYHPVSTVDFDEFTAAFNLAYSDYFTPVVMTPGSFRNLMIHDDLLFEASIAAIDNGQIVGTGLLGIRGHRGWIGGMGVIPARRRQGIGRQIMRHLLAMAARHGAREVSLEVIEANRGAIELYRSLGFAPVRYLLVLERQPQPTPVSSPNVAIRETAASMLLAQFHAFHTTSICWQRGYRSLVGRAEFITGWGAFKEDTLVGYALGWANDYEIRLADLATASGHQTVAQSLLSHLHHLYPDAFGSSYNVADDDPVLSSYQAMGYTSAFRQIEMRRSLDNNRVESAQSWAGEVSTDRENVQNEG